MVSALLPSSPRALLSFGASSDFALQHLSPSGVAHRCLVPLVLSSVWLIDERIDHAQSADYKMTSRAYGMGSGAVPTAQSSSVLVPQRFTADDLPIFYHTDMRLMPHGVCCGCGNLFDFKGKLAHELAETLYGHSRRCQKWTNRFGATPSKGNIKDGLLAKPWFGEKGSERLTELPTGMVFDETELQEMNDEICKVLIENGYEERSAAPICKRCLKYECGACDAGKHCVRALIKNRSCVVAFATSEVAQLCIHRLLQRENSDDLVPLFSVDTRGAPNATPVSLSNTSATCPTSFERMAMRVGLNKIRLLGDPPEVVFHCSMAHPEVFVRGGIVSEANRGLVIHKNRGVNTRDEAQGPQATRATELLRVLRPGNTDPKLDDMRKSADLTRPLRRTGRDALLLHATLAAFHTGQTLLDHWTGLDRQRLNAIFQDPQR